MKKKSLELKGIKFGHISGVTVITLVLWDSLLISLSECALRIRHQMKNSCTVKKWFRSQWKCTKSFSYCGFLLFWVGGGYCRIWPLTGNTCCLYTCCLNQITEKKWRTAVLLIVAFGGITACCLHLHHRLNRTDSLKVISLLKQILQPLIVPCPCSPLVWQFPSSTAPGSLQMTSRMKQYSEWKVKWTCFPAVPNWNH